jgi:hypothetical protein
MCAVSSVEELIDSSKKDKPDQRTRKFHPRHYYWILQFRKYGWLFVLTSREAEEDVAVGNPCLIWRTTLNRFITK